MLSARIIAASIAVATAAAGGLAAAEPECPPAVALAGPDAVVADVSAVLESRGIAIAAVDGCEPVAIALSRRGESIAVERQGDAEPALVSGAAAAATVIEGWVRVDLASPLLAVREVDPARVAPPAAATIEQRTVVIAPQPRRPSISAAADVGIGGDGSTWSGVSGAGCIHIAPLCIGAMLRFAIDNRTGGDSVRLDGDRLGFEVLVTVETAVSRGPWRLRPGLGIGQGVVYTRAGGDDEEDGTVLLRGQVGIGYQLGARASVQVDPAIVYGLGASPIINDFDRGGLVATYPGDPGLHVRLGAGLRVEVP